MSQHPKWHLDRFIRAKTDITSPVFLTYGSLYPCKSVTQMVTQIGHLLKHASTHTHQFTKNADTLLNCIACHISRWIYNILQAYVQPHSHAEFYKPQDISA